MIESILSKLSEVSERYIEIENLLSQPDITSNQENYIKLSKEYSDLSPIVKAFKDYEKSESSLDFQHAIDNQMECYPKFVGNNTYKNFIFFFTHSEPAL